MTRTLKALGDRMLGALLPATTADAAGCPRECWCHRWLDHSAWTCTRSDCSTYVSCYECC
ncbi:hypothetical protein Nocox_22330 [Nonomuraea coxensis DSM 45129]|uniref:Uncharacterized protein n=1 Tax=Nonomuraea coxensis DSM 45129 TaxID=1122611 RepID=A0ABX8U2V1_9ACTN|nr:hypothetical protein [Nonomuraea coxensis]QYC42070.1 hypothetical protein Nocox_22330 [Nonomuraea coxensis DSM 45129]